jgi:hypothetical protein
MHPNKVFGLTKAYAKATAVFSRPLGKSVGPGLGHGAFGRRMTWAKKQSSDFFRNLDKSRYFRRIATRHEKKACHSKEMLAFAAVLWRLRRCVNSA